MDRNHTNAILKAKDYPTPIKEVKLVDKKKDDIAIVIILF